MKSIACLTMLLFACNACDGERAKPPLKPAPPGPVAIGDAGVTVQTDAADPIVERAPGFLDAPAGTLDALYAGLAAAENKDPSGRVLLMFLGDSHTAGDSMTQRLRTTWQAKFGDAGRGLVAAGKPTTRHYYQRDVQYGASGTWKSAVGSHRRHGTQDPEPYGISGIRIYGEQKGAQLWVETAPGQRVAQLEIFYYAAPDHGLLRYRVDDAAWQQLPTKTAPIEPPHPARHVISVVDGPHKLTIEHGGGGVLDLFGVAMERLRPGVLVDALGVVGRQISQLRSWDWSIIGEQLSTRDPRLVVLQYGTNEADDPDLDLEKLASDYDDTILRIRAAAPTTSILILGPPDLAKRAGGKACDHQKPDAGIIPECEWHTPAVLDEIIAVEHAAALRNHVAFFDTFAAMGGPDQMAGWVLAEPKVAYKDHVHFTDLGYQRWADALSAALIDGYEHWRAGQNLPPTEPLHLPQPPVPAAPPPLPGPVDPAAP